MEAPETDPKPTTPDPKPHDPTWAGITLRVGFVSEEYATRTVSWRAALISPRTDLLANVPKDTPRVGSKCAKRFQDADAPGLDEVVSNG